MASSMPAPHDLLRIADATGLRSDAPLPDWLAPEWLARAPLTVRRDRIERASLIPVGLRGLTRSQRLGAWLTRDAVLARITPEDLARAAAWECHPDLGRLPAMRALADVAPRLQASGLAWGPTGSAGFMLASGLPVLHADSDLDLLVRAPVPLDAARRDALRELSHGVTCRLDIQIDTGRGGFSLAEWLRGNGRVLLKTARGPLRTNDPWQAATSAGSTAGTTVGTTAGCAPAAGGIAR